MLFFWNSSYSFWGQQCRSWDNFEKGITASSKDLAQLIQCDKIMRFKLLLNFRKVFNHYFWGEVIEDHWSIYIFSPSINVDSCDCIIEQDEYFLFICRIWHSSLNGLDGYVLRLVSTAKEWIELVYDIGLWIFFCTNNFFLRSSVLSPLRFLFFIWYIHNHWRFRITFVCSKMS